MYKCFYCNHWLVWDSDFDSEDVGYDEDGIVHFYTCPSCGARDEVFEPKGGKECTI